MTPSRRLAPLVDKWFRWIKVFDAIRDAAGDYMHYPRSGSYFDQFAYEMEIIGVIRDAYKDERERKQKADASRRSR